MSYHIIPNIILILAILGLIAMILRRLPEAVSEKEHESNLETVHDKLSKKGLPVLAFSKLKTVSRFWSQKIWHFVLEAKDLKPSAASGYKIRKMFAHQEKQGATDNQDKARPAGTAAALPLEQTTKSREDEILAAIKKEPRNHKNYDDLGKLYLEQKSFSDAKDIYLYLVNHESGHSEHHAKLAYSCYQLREYTSAIEHYKKSIALDSTHPNRYYNLALCLSVMGKHKEALENFQKAASLEPQNQKYQMALEKAKNLNPSPVQ